MTINDEIYIIEYMLYIYTVCVISSGSYCKLGGFDP